MTGRGRVIPDNCRNSLLDAQARLLDAWDALDAAQKRVEERFQDIPLLIHMSKISRALTDIERHVGNARQNKCDERRAV